MGKCQRGDIKKPPRSPNTECCQGPGAFEFENFLCSEYEASEELRPVQLGAVLPFVLDEIRQRCNTYRAEHGLRTLEAEMHQERVREAVTFKAAAPVERSRNKPLFRTNKVVYYVVGRV